MINPKTTIAGVLVLAGVLAHAYMTNMWDIEAIGKAVVGLAIALGFVAAADAK